MTVWAFNKPDALQHVQLLYRESQKGQIKIWLFVECPTQSEIEGQLDCLNTASNSSFSESRKVTGSCTSICRNGESALPLE